MALKKIMGVFACALILGSAALATAGVPDLDLSTASRAYGGPETAVLFNLPNGGGSAFTSAAIIGGTVDATITLTLLDGAGVAIVNFPFEDAWIESADSGMAACTGGATADANTNASGMTSWVTPLQAGGSSQALTVVMISGAALTSSAGVAVSHNSADINGDGNVNLTDVPLFAGDFYGGVYAFRSDFSYDGSVNLSDVVKLAQALGAACP
jgi:hypothetical protein